MLRKTKERTMDRMSAFSDALNEVKKLAMSSALKVLNETDVSSARSSAAERGMLMPPKSARGGQWHAENCGEEEIGGMVAITEQNCSIQQLESSEHHGKRSFSSRDRMQRAVSTRDGQVAFDALKGAYGAALPVKCVQLQWRIPWSDSLGGAAATQPSELQPPPFQNWHVTCFEQSFSKRRTRPPRTPARTTSRKSRPPGVTTARAAASAGGKEAVGTKAAPMVEAATAAVLAAVKVGAVTEVERAGAL
eukprot:2376200-Pleurochrysis_carterae.AAC.3